MPGSGYATAARSGIGRREGAAPHAGRGGRGDAPRRTFKLPRAAGLHFPACRGGRCLCPGAGALRPQEVVTGVGAALGTDLTEASPALTAAAWAAQALRVTPSRLSDRRSASSPPAEGGAASAAGGRFRCLSSGFPSPSATRVTRRFVGAGAAFVRLRARG